MRQRVFIWLMLLLGLSPLVRASHIVGAELGYRCLDPSQATYEVTLTLYRDCAEGNVGFDPVAFIFLFDGNSGERLGYIPLAPAFLTPDTIPVPDQGCVANPLNICLEQGQYRDTLVFPPRPGGYDLGWARCCRNAAVSNIQPAQGISVLAHVPSTLPNSSPQFQALPPLFVCTHEPFVLDFAATDAEGDSLAYQLVDPWSGRNDRGWGAHLNFASVVPQNPMGPPPYESLAFLPGFTASNPFGNATTQLDPQSGLMSVLPTQTGLFVFTVAVREYRNGQLLSEQRRDFQVWAVDCLPQGTLPAISHRLPGGQVGDTLYIQAADSFCYEIELTDPSAQDVLALFPASPALGTGGSISPPFAQITSLGTNPVQATVCWRPPCEQAGRTIPLIVGGRDLADCLGANQVFDTVWVVVQPGPKVDAGSDTSICYHGGYAQLAGSQVSSYRWQPVNGLSDSGIARPVAQPDSSTRYTLTGRDEFGCPSYDSVWVRLIRPLQAQIEGSDSICLGQAVQLAATGGVSLQWFNGLGSPDQVLSPVQSESFWVLPFDSLGCRGDTAWHEVYVETNLPVAAFTFAPPTGFVPLPVQFENQSQYASRYQWFFGDGSESSLDNPAHAYASPGNYTVALMVDNAIGCPDTLTGKGVEVWEPEMYFPNAFTPNGDGHNDAFYFPGGGIARIELHIFDRWGRVVFQSEDPGFRWRGQGPDGLPLSEGVYAYHVTLYPWNGDAWSRRGSVTLVR